MNNQKILGETMTNRNNLERSPPLSTISPGQGLEAPDRAGKGL